MSERRAQWTLETLRKHRAEILSIAARHGAHEVRVFGSIARAEARPDSDVDLLVDFEPKRSLLDHGALLMDLEEALGCRVDVVNSRALRPRFRARVEREAVLL